MDRLPVGAPAYLEYWRRCYFQSESYPLSRPLFTDALINGLIERYLETRDVESAFEARFITASKIQALIGAPPEDVAKLQAVMGQVKAHDQGVRQLLERRPVRISASSLQEITGSSVI